MTPRQAELLAFLRSYQAERGFCPTYDEIQAAMKLNSKSRISRIVDCLQERGLVRRLPGRRRAIEVIAPATPTAEPRRMLASRLATVARNTLARGEPRPGELEAAILAVLP